MAGSAFAVVTGVLSDAPTSRATKGGSTVVSLRLGWSRKMGQETKWANIDVTVFGKDGERAMEWLSKGSVVTVMGELQQDEWDDRETGKKRYKHLIVASRLVFGPKKDDGDEKPAQQKETKKATSKKTEEFPDASDEFDNIPF